MKSFHLYPRSLTAMAATLLMLGLAFGAGAQEMPLKATILRVQGKARFALDMKTWQPARNGTAFGAGSVLQTADNSTMDLRLGDGDAADTVHLAPNTVLTLDKLSTESSTSGTVQDTQLGLKGGEITGRKGQAVSGSRYEITLPTAIVGVRSGSYRMSASGIVEAFSGELVTTTGEGISTGPLAVAVITAGHRWNSETRAITDIPASASADLPPPKSQPASAQTPAKPVNPALKGPGLGGSLRKF